MAGDYGVAIFESEVDKQSQSDESSFGFPSNKRKNELNIVADNWVLAM